MTHPTLTQLVADKKFSEIDALIAKKVMGWTQSMGCWSPPNAPPEYNVYGLVLPKYSTDISAAWEVVEMLGMSIVAPDATYACGEYRAGCQWEVEHKGRVAFADTAPLAICLAALKTVMNE